MLSWPQPVPRSRFDRGGDGPAPHVQRIQPRPCRPRPPHRGPHRGRPVLSGGTGATAEAILSLSAASRRGRLPRPRSGHAAHRPSPRAIPACPGSQPGPENWPGTPRPVTSTPWCAAQQPGKVNVRAVFAAVRRVLRPSGRFVFDIGGVFAGVTRPDARDRPASPTLGKLTEQITASEHVNGPRALADALVATATAAEKGYRDDATVLVLLRRGNEPALSETDRPRGHAAAPGTADRPGRQGDATDNELLLTASLRSVRPSVFRPTTFVPNTLARKGSVRHAPSRIAESKGAQAV